MKTSSYAEQQSAASQLTTGPALRLVDLRKSYGEVEAVRGIDLEVERGEIFAFLGPNGAGKTTTVEILEGFRPRSSGEVSVFGVDPTDGTREWRDRIGIVLQESAPDPGLTVHEALALYAGYYSQPRSVVETIALVGLEGKHDRQATSLSGGERRRLDFALALIGDPELIFLDEPTTGFDPSARRQAWDVIENLRDLGKTIFLTTHYMDEAERLADRIAVIVGGIIVAQGTPRTLGGRDRDTSTIKFTLPAGITANELPATLGRLLASDRGNGSIALHTDAPLAELALLAEWAGKNALELRDLEVTRPTLEDTYLRLTQGDNQGDPQ
jgi:ABC-2 type transport system ATP-binding protein